jgi:geranyl-CoA carboxylase alpha subunit
MKMEHEIRAGIDGTVAEVRVSEGDQVMPRQLLAAVEPAAKASEAGGE